LKFFSLGRLAPPGTRADLIQVNARQQQRQFLGHQLQGGRLGKLI
jgi:hypothetical protein